MFVQCNVHGTSLCLIGFNGCKKLQILYDAATLQTAVFHSHSQI